MSKNLLNAAWRVETMVGRKNELEHIKRVILSGGERHACNVILVTGPGGIGKSRLLEEVQRLAGHPDMVDEAIHNNSALTDDIDRWPGSDSITVSDIIDLMDIRLSTRSQLMKAIRDALSWRGGVDFSNYDWALREFEKAKLNSSSFNIIEGLREKVETAFWTAFSEHSSTRHIILILDTAERLVLRSSEWAVGNGLLEPNELVISSQQWLIRQIRLGRFLNTTLIFAGRDGEDEGGSFFNSLRSILHENTTPWNLTQVNLRPLNMYETREFFSILAKQWNKRAGSADATQDDVRISRSMKALATDTERIDVLYLMTAGRPVLLSLYSDLIHEPGELPEPFLMNKTQAEQALAERGPEMLQAEIEDSFIDLLFQMPGLRSDIMQALARCPAGLSARQLHYLLDSSENIDPEKWEQDVYSLRGIRNHLNQIRQLSIVRPRRDDPLNLEDINPYRRSQADDTQRIGLQDEIYRIYADRIYAKKALQAAECREREMQYSKLKNWAEWKLQELRASLRHHQEADERRLTGAIQLPTQAVAPQIPSPLPSEQEERSRIQQAIAEWELEKLHYSLLADPAAGLNDDYTDLVERRWLSNNEEADFIGQQEMWRVLHDPDALKFNGLKAGELGVLRRMAQEEDPTRWIKRFIMRRQFVRAIQFGEELEAAFDNEPENERRTWMHPLNAGERRIWMNYARIMLGKDAEKGVEDLRYWLELLVNLADAPKTMRIGHSDETGFQNHYALPRLLRLIAVGYNFAGYGCLVRSQFSHAVDYYGKALTVMRKTRYEAQYADTLNNLGLALASQGKEERGTLVCADALENRKAFGAEISIAYSLNTLALIGNSMQRTPMVWREAAQAAAIFRQAGDIRGLGLALIQVGIGLRRLGNSKEPGVVMEVSREELYRTAQDALGEAVDIFMREPEILRLVEAKLEFGCVLRDQIPLIDPVKEEARWIRATRNAESELSQTIRLAEGSNFPAQALQAHVDLACTYFLIKDYGKAEAEAETAMGRISQHYIILPKSRLGPDASEAHHFYQLAKLQRLYGSIAMERFKQRRELLRVQIGLEREDLSETVKRDADTAYQLDKAAEHYVLSLFYGQMFSPRSRSLVITFDQIYNHVKSFNAVEHEMFYESQKRAAKKYRQPHSRRGNREIIQPYNFSNLQEWLHDCFGLSED